MGQLSTRQVALLSALVVAVLGGLLAGAAVDLVGTSLAPWWPFLCALLILALAYAAFSIGIERFVHGRIKSLYRTVHDLRRGKASGNGRGDTTDELTRVNAEVAEWASQRRTEIKELEDRERYRREFIGNLAHELKTPIFNIQGYILTLLEGGLEDQKVNRDFLERASNSVDRLMKIVEDLDLITKLESGVMELRLTRVDLHALVKETMDTMEMHAREKGVRLVNAVAPGTEAMADRNRMAQVFTNLLNNAINYGRTDGSCKVTSYALGDQLVVEVSDDGVGISGEHLPRLFERFYRVGKSRSRNEGGSGLGLAIVKHIIDAHGQTIAVKSEEGRGTTFVLTLQQPE
ncbi:MAG: sensor histidine kinase [Flavobacteriales bacterium]|nr:sensor histidine kinase [Flavobacteriales bacterium]